MGSGTDRGPAKAAAEVELKLVVSDQAALDRIARAAGGASARAVVQVNHFFDTEAGALDKAKHIVRLRQENQSFFLTAKGPQRPSAAGAVSEKHEVELELPPARALEYLSGLEPVLSGFALDPLTAAEPLVATLRALAGDAPLVEVGAFTNHRTRVPLSLAGPPPLSLVLELDRTEFPGGVVDHELEAELPEGLDPVAAERALTAWLGTLGVSGQSGPSKSKRFFAALRQAGSRTTQDRKGAP